MANDLNIVGLVGRLTRPADMRYTNSGYAICSFTIAVNKRRKQTDGTWQDQASFFDCSYFGKAAEGVSPWLQKGQQVGVQGSLEQQTWENNGQKRSKIAVIVDSLQLVGSSNQNANAKPSNSSYGQQRSQQNSFSQSVNSFTGGSTTNSYPKPASMMPKPAAKVISASTPPPAPTLFGGPEEFDDDDKVPF